MTNRMPEAMNTGRRPLISENGARTMGATAKPVVKVVMPTSAATLLTPHSAVICPTPGLYDPAENAVSAVIMQATHIVKSFLFPDH